MNIREILSKTDHTLLSPDATLSQIRELCADAVRYKTASVCIPPCYVKAARSECEGKVKICTVIGFPTGYCKTAVKVKETEEAVKDGADEIDMVIHIGALKDGRDDEVADDIRAVRAACPGKILKVIVECCLLTQEEKIRITKIVSASGADFIKTSTGFSKGGATREDVALFARERENGIRIKAAGGIATLQDAQDFLDLGAERLGTSRIVKAVKAMENTVPETEEKP